MIILRFRSTPARGFFRGMVTVLCLLLPATLSLAEPGTPPAATSEPEAVQSGPAPQWVEAVEWSHELVQNPPGTPAESLLLDNQAHLTRQGSEYYFRHVTRLLNAEGVRQNAEQSVTFSPEYQQVTWHVLRIFRGDKVIDLRPQAKFRRLQREMGLEAQVYNGQITAVAVLEDVRVGDVLETAYTLSDRNPLMRGNYTYRMGVGNFYPVRHESVIARLQDEPASPHWYYWIPPGIQGLPEAIFRLSQLRSAMRAPKEGDESVYRWQADNLPALTFEGEMSGQDAPYYPTLRCVSFDSWHAVSGWAEGLFSSCGELPEETRLQVEAWRKLPTPAERLAAAVHWVQRDIRYFSMAMGENNIRPRPLRDIVSTRFGDCKDKSVLLVALLRGLGFQAWPVLVCTYNQDRLRNDGPDPYAFNHAIVAYEYEGRLRWVDPTLKPQGGAPGDWATPRYRLGLILRPDEVAFTEIPDPDSTLPDTETVDTFSFEEDGKTAVLDTVVRLRGLEADSYRERMEVQTPTELSQRWYNYLARFYRRIDEVSAPEVQDDRSANILSIRARYRLPEFVHVEKGVSSVNVYAYGLRAMLNPPEGRRRHWPYALPYGRFVRQRMELNLPFQVAIDQKPQAIRTAGLVYTAEKGLTGQSLRLLHDLHYTADYVNAAGMQVYCNSVEEILTDMGTSVHSVPPRTDTPVAKEVKAP